jgi:predicted  nucleic acid-binding Zn-ribbon protein
MNIGNIKFQGGILYILLSLVISITTIESQRVSEDEFKSSKKVIFQNKTYLKAPPALRNFHESIGKRLSKSLSEKPNESHFYDGVTLNRIEPAGNKLGGDIFSFDDSTDIGHINTIQRIIAGYIQVAYQYKEEDALFLAKFIIYYNAINRRKIEYINKKYNNEINNVINPKDVGIANSYKEWPGHTQIILPIEGNVLKKFNKDLTLDELSDRVNQIKDTKATQDEKNKLTEIIVEKSKEEKKLLKEKKDEIAKEVTVLEKKKKDLEVKLNDIGTDVTNKEDPKKLKQEKAEVEKQIAKLEDTKSKIEAQENKTVAISEKAEEVKSNTEVPTEKTTETKAEAPKEPSPEVVKLEKELEKVKEELAAKTEEKSKNEFSANVVDGKIPIVKIFPDGSCANEIHLLDPNQDDFVFKGNYTQICGKTFKDFGSSLLVIGLKDSKENIRLVLLDKKELKPSMFSDSGIHSKSPLEVFDNLIYAIEFENGKYYLSRFDANLKRMTRSDQEILPDSTITVFGKKIYINARVEGGFVEIRVFNKDDLKFIKKTQT